jgi:hypothetical protein
MVTKWEGEGATGPEVVALSYLSQRLPGFRATFSKRSIQRAYAGCKS